MTAPETKFPREYVNKTIAMKFCGSSSLFHLSHGLFSSFDIDAGTRLLLKSIAAHVDLGTLSAALDVGCGVGVIGLSIAQAASAGRVVLQDRDALAVAFARENAKENSLGNVSFDCGLAFWNMAGRAFDLIVSNLPAKAGRPVLESFFRLVPVLLSREGSAAVVIVTPLAKLAREAIQASGCLLFHVESTSQHSVFHFTRDQSRGLSGGQALEGLTPYLRTRQKFFAAGIDYELETAYNLPDFDTTGYAVQLAQEVLAASPVQGDAFFWNPGQGHLPVFAQKKTGKRLGSIRIAGRDALELAMTGRNLVSHGREPSGALLLSTEAAMGEAVEPASVDFLCAIPHPVPKAPWHADLADSAEKLLRKGGTFLTAGSSTDVFRILGQCRRFKLVESVKKLGHRAVLLRLP